MSRLFVAQKQIKLGRPKLPKGEAKSCMIRARVAPTELMAMEAAARAKCSGISDWARKILLAAARRYRPAARL
jgi:hypothetical protein